MINLELRGHEDRYAVEQLCLALFDVAAQGQAVSTLYRGKTWLSAVTTVQIGEKTTRSVRRLKAAEETVRLRRQALQQSLYLAALPHLPSISTRMGLSSSSNTSSRPQALSVSPP